MQVPRHPLPPARLTPEFLLRAYQQGYFPMAAGREWRGPLAWFSPEERGIIPLEAFHLPRRLRDRLRSRRFVVTSDRDFPGVIRGCAGARLAEEETWINAEIEGVYTELHEAGHVHSIEAWLPGTGELDSAGVRQGGVLVGGLYGVHIGRAFFAESKFCRPEEGGRDASKVCLAHLVLHLRRQGFLLLDTQYWNEHLEQFGCVEIPRVVYMKRLAAALRGAAAWSPFDTETNLRMEG